MHLRLRRIAALLASVFTLSALAVTSASATTSYSKNANYQFASNYTMGKTTPFVVSNSPFSFASANQKLAANGVDLSVSGPSYASSAIIALLGHLSTMFNSSGKFVPPAIVGSNNLLYNLYFDTSGNQTYFGWGAHDPYVFTSEDGDSAASMGQANNTMDAANFTTFAGEPGSGNAAVGLSGTMTMEQVKAAFAGRTDVGGVKDPLVWAWIGIQTTPNQAGYITSVDGVKQVKTTTTFPAPTGLRSVPRFTRALLSWHAVPGAAGRDYRVQVFKGTRLIFNKLTTNTSITVTGLSEKTTYRWRVGVSGFKWSTYQSFRTR
jgi:hypothetical protein